VHVALVVGGGGDGGSANGGESGSKWKQEVLQMEEAEAVVIRTMSIVVNLVEGCT
jgi:hypothetical protein